MTQTESPVGQASSLSFVSAPYDKGGPPDCPPPPASSKFRKILLAMLTSLLIVCHPCHDEDIDDELRFIEFVTTQNLP